MRKNKKIISGIDLGTREIKVVIAEVDLEKEYIYTRGYASVKSEGILKGDIIYYDRVLDALDRAIQKAENRSKLVINDGDVYFNITGSSVFSKNETLSTVINTKDGKIKEKNVEELLDDVKKRLLKKNLYTINIIENDYIIDNKLHVTSPIGRSGNHLDISAHIIYTDNDKIKTITKILEEIGIENPVPVFSGLATAIASIAEEDLEHGTLLIDLGGGTTEFILFKQYSVIFSGVLTVGIDHIVNDLSIGLEIDLKSAEKIVYNNLIDKCIESGQTIIEKEGFIQRKQIPLATIEQIIELRTLEIIEMIKDSILENVGIDKINNGIILAGYGQNVNFIKRLFKDLFEISVTTSSLNNNTISPDNIKESNEYITAVGLIKYGIRNILSKKPKSRLISNVKKIFTNFIKLG